jgi:polyisoprenyl-phosphate glycosyltransferase
MKLWILCPVYLDVNTFQMLRQNVLRVLATTKFKKPTFVVVDDTGGQDPDMKFLEEYRDVRIITPPFNLGHQRTIVFGLRSLATEMSEDDYVVTMDSDGEDRPEDLPELLAPLLDSVENTRKVVLARRTKRRESLKFKLFYFAFKILFKVLTGRIIDSGNYAAYRGWLTKNVIFHPHFDLCYSSSLVSLNLDLEFHPCPRGTRYAGRSHMNFTKLAMHGIRMLMPFIDRIAVRALLTFSLISVSALGLSFAVFILKYLNAEPIPGWAMFTFLLSLGLSLNAVASFIILFTVFSQSQGVSLQTLDRSKRWSDGQKHAA